VDPYYYTWKKTVPQSRVNVYDQNDWPFKEENMKTQSRNKLGLVDNAFPFRGPDLLCPLVRGKHKIENGQKKWKG
jgi:hypothetical protein